MRRKIKTKNYLIKDIDCKITVEITSTIKDIWGWIEEYIDNLPYEWFEPYDDTFEILYKDGTYDYINYEYDGHKVKKKNIQSIVYNNPEDSIVYGTYQINEYGVVTASNKVQIAEENIVEI